MRQLFLLTIIPLVLVACSKDSASTTSASSDEQTVNIFLSSQGRSTVEGSTAENAIKTVDILVFDGSGGIAEDATFLYSRYAWNLSGNTYRTTLMQGTDLDIYFAINARQFIDSGEIVAGMTWSQTREKMIMTNPESFDMENSGIPMWGYKRGYTVSESSDNNVGTIKLLRAMASTDIRVSSSNFTLEKGYIVYGADKGYLPFSLDNISSVDSNGDFKVLAPEVPSAMNATTDWSYEVTDGSNAITNVFYMYENTAPENSRKNTKIVIEGRWSGSSKSGNTFYPIAFRNSDTNDVLPVTRNHKYTVIVTSVNGDGYDDLNSAKQSDDVNMNYDVIDWNENVDGEINIDGTYYFAISSRNATLYRPTGSTTELVFSTNVDMDDILMKYDSTDTGVNGSIDTHPRFTVEVVTVTNSDGSQYNAFRITTKQEYGTDDNPATLIVTAGRIAFNITMTQVDDSPNDWDYGANYDNEL